MDYKRLIEDFKSGKLDKNKYYLVLDNDDIGFYTVGEEDEEYERLCELYGRGNGYNDIGDILYAAGVPCEWC